MQKKLSGWALKCLNRFYSTGKIKSIFSGILTTSILQSSFAVSLMVLVFVGAGIMTMENAIGVILGSNIGTTVTAWIVATICFKVKIESFALPFVELSFHITSQMHSYNEAKCLELVDNELAVKILEKMDLHDVELILRQCNEIFSNNMLNGLPAKPAALLKEKLSHPVDTVGAFMTPILLRLRKEITIQEAISTNIREKANFSSQIFLVDEEGKLEGVVNIHDLLSHESTATLSSIMIVDFPKFFADTDIASVANHPGWYDFHDIPIIDSSERLIGALHFKSTRKDKQIMDEKGTNEIIVTSNALGELYRIGMTGFLQSVGK
ncbi:MAG: Na/Pi symporter [Bacteroidales bacterium]